MRRRATFTQRDLVRALKAARGAGLQVVEALISRDGDLRLVFATAQTVPSSQERNSWD